MDDDRTRTISWHDPMIAARQAMKLSGLEFLRGVASGAIPQAPVSALIGMWLVEVDEETAVFLLEPHESLYNPIGTVHGGIIATACDSAASCAVHLRLAENQVYTTLEIKVNYVRPVTVATGPLRCTGRIIHFGRRVGTAESRLEDAAGKLYAHATVTCAIMSAERGNG